MTATTLPFIDAATIAQALPWEDAVACLEEALIRGFDPARSAPRSIIDVQHGQMLLMPAELNHHVGVKIGTVAPDNPSSGLPRVQALYVLADSLTLTPVALMDGTALTTLRTAALSAVAVGHLARADARNLVVFGTGPQAGGHVHAIRAVRAIEKITIIGRRPEATGELLRQLSESNIVAETGTDQALSDADIVVCATTAATPLFDSALLKKDVCVVAVGSHAPDQRELDSNLIRRARQGAGVVVETREVALAEAGDIAMAVAEDAIGESDFIEIRDLVHRKARAEGASVFKSVGMGWQDLILASEILRRTHA